MQQDSALLQLPVEVKEQIYTYCYLPPHISKQTTQKSSQARRFTNDNDGALSAYLDERQDWIDPSYWPLEMYSSCQHARSHLSLFFTCHQLHHELFPIFASRHLFNLSSAFTFSSTQAGPILPVQRLQDLKHIALRWPLSSSTCSCSLYGHQRKHHHHVSPHADITADFTSCINALQSSSSQPSLSSLEFHLPLPCSSTSSTFAKYRALFRNVVDLVETLAPPNADFPRVKGYFLVQPRWPKPSTEPVRVRICTVKQVLWERLNHATLILEPDCVQCHNTDPPIEGHTHTSKWLDEDDIASAIDGSRAQAFPDPEFGYTKRWKVVFEPGGGFKYWGFAMQELLRRRQEVVPTQNERAVDRKSRLFEDLQCDEMLGVPGKLKYPAFSTTSFSAGR